MNRDEVDDNSKDMGDSLMADEDDTKDSECTSEDGVDAGEILHDDITEEDV